jgi:hypothetical protein
MNIRSNHSFAPQVPQGEISANSVPLVWQTSRYKPNTQFADTNGLGRYVIASSGASCELRLHGQRIGTFTIDDAKRRAQAGADAVRANGEGQMK